MKIDRQRRVFATAGLIYLSITTLVIGLAFSQWAYDDPYITFRYARNLAGGEGFVYNPGEQVLSTTTPLFALLLALLSRLQPDIPRLANWIGAFSLAVGGLLLWVLAQDWETPLAGWAGLLLYPTFPLLLGTLGSELPLYLAFCLGAFAAFARQRYRVTAVACALAVLTRPDGILVPAVLGAAFLLQDAWRRRPIPWQALLLFAVMVLPWFVFAWAYFGSPLPATLAAKRLQGAMHISTPYFPGLLVVMGTLANRWQYWLELLLALVGLAAAVWKRRSWLLLFSWTFLFFFSYSLLGVSRYFWYYAPLVPGFLAMVGLGIWLLSTILAGLKWSGQESQLRLSQGMGWAVILTLSLAQGIGAWQQSQQLDARSDLYRQVGEWLNQNTLNKARVGALEVGIIGYYAMRPMVDFAGLIQPDVARQLRPETTYADAARWAVETYRPDYLVLQKGSFPALEQGAVAHDCQLVKQYPRPQGYPYDLEVYACTGE
jgi:hypothetical protein